MSKLTSIILSLLLLGQSFQISVTDFLQLDDLYTHAVEHFQKEDDSLMEFISLHYGNEKVTHSKEHPQHKNLPFQQEIDVLNSNTLYTQENKKNKSDFLLYSILRSNFYYLGFYSNFELQSLFQPPISL